MSRGRISRREDPFDLFMTFGTAYTFHLVAHDSIGKAERDGFGLSNLNEMFCELAALL